MDTAPLNALSPASLPPRDGRPDGGDWAVLPTFEGLYPSAQLARTLAMAAKRVIDLVGAGFGLVFLGPLLLGVAAAIRLDSPGPALFRQRRMGRDGREFSILKFRTMRADAEHLLVNLEEHNEAALGVLFKMRDDPRVTRLGRFLRRTNLDELPQLVNVVRGEMSLVGPRPFQNRDCDRLRALDPVAYARRLEFPPGLTGAWQVGRRSPVDSDRLLDLDLEYADNWSLALDLRLLYRTFFIVLAGFRGRS